MSKGLCVSREIITTHNGTRQNPGDKLGLPMGAGFCIDCLEMKLDSVGGGAGSLRDLVNDVTGGDEYGHLGLRTGHPISMAEIFFIQRNFVLRVVKKERCPPTVCSDGGQTRPFERRHLEDERQLVRPR